MIVGIVPIVPKNFETIQTTESLAIFFFARVCGVEKLEEFHENVVSRRELDVTDFL